MTELPPHTNAENLTLVELVRSSDVRAPDSLHRQVYVPWWPLASRARALRVCARVAPPYVHRPLIPPLALLMAGARSVWPQPSPWPSPW